MSTTPQFPDSMTDTRTAAAALGGKTPAPAKPDATQTVPGGTDYAVLIADPNDRDRWTQVTAVLASSAHDAIRKSSEGRPGTYVAVPARSFKPVTVKVETVTRVTLDDA